METGLKVVMAMMMGFFIWRIWPHAIEQLKNGPKGSSNDWMTYALLMGAVVVFVLVLMKLV